MPLYEYRCRACQERFEVLQRMDAGGNGASGASGAACPKCDSHDLERLLSTFAAATGGGRSEAQPCMPAGCCGGGACGWDN